MIIRNLRKERLVNLRAVKEFVWHKHCTYMLLDTCQNHRKNTTESEGQCKQWLAIKNNLSTLAHRLERYLTRQCGKFEVPVLTAQPFKEPEATLRKYRSGEIKLRK